MKTIKSVLIIAAVSASVLTASAAEPLLSPRASGIRHPVIASTGVKDTNLLAEWPKSGSRAVTFHPVISSGVKDQDLLVAMKNCPMIPKTKDTPACKRMCKVAGIK